MRAIMRRTILASAATTAVLLLATSAHAGPEIMIRPAYGSAGKSSPIVYAPTATARLSGDAGKVYDGTGEPYGGGFIGDAYLGWKIIPYLSAGIGAGFRKSSASAPDDTIKDLARSAWSIGPYVRGYVPLIPAIDPWISIGIRYMSDTQTYSRASAFPGVNEKWTLHHHGIAIPIAIGIDYPVLPLLSIGPSFEYTIVSSAGGCAKVGADDPRFTSNSFCTDADDRLKITSSKSYSVWSIGLDVRLSL